MERKIGYVGIDDRYYKSLKQELEDLYGGKGGDTFVCKKYSNEKDQSFKAILRGIIKDPPDILYLDFSSKQEEMLRLGRILANIKDTKNMSIVGLNSPQESPAKRKNLVKKILDYGIPVTQIKLGGDPHDPVYDSIALSSPNAVKEPAFVTSTYPKGRPSRIGELIKICSISVKEVIIESNIKFSEGEIIELETNIPPDVLKSKQFQVNSVSSGENYYRKLYRISLTPCLLDMLDETKYDTEEILKEEEDRRTEKINEKALPDFENWILTTIKQSRPKAHKILVIDHKLSIVHQMSDWIATDDYCIRLQSVLENQDRYIHQYRPDFVTFDFEKVPPPPSPPEPVEGEEKSKEEPVVVDPLDYNAAESFKSLMTQLKAVGLKDTLVIVFNSGGYSSKQLQKSFNHPRILTSGEPFGLAFFQQLVDMYRAKHQPVIEEEVVYLDSTSEFAEATYWVETNVFIINESHMDFQVQRTLPVNTSYIADSPAMMFITIVPHKEGSQYQSQEDMYYALIHSLEPEARKELRAELIKKKE